MREWANQERSKGRAVKVRYGKVCIGRIKYIWNNESGNMIRENFRDEGKEGGFENG